MLPTLKSVLLLLSLCGTCRAEPAPTALPAWTEIDGHACYDLEGAKSLKVFELACRTLGAKHSLLTEQLVLLEGKSLTYSELARSCMAQQHALAALNVSADKAIVALQTDLAAERRWSLRGDAGTYVIIGAVVVAVAAGVAGYELYAVSH